MPQRPNQLPSSFWPGQVIDGPAPTLVAFGVWPSWARSEMQRAVRPPSADRAARHGRRKEYSSSINDYCPRRKRRNRRSGFASRGSIRGPGNRILSIRRRASGPALGGAIHRQHHGRRVVEIGIVGVGVLESLEAPGRVWAGSLPNPLTISSTAAASASRAPCRAHRLCSLGAAGFHQGVAATAPRPRHRRKARLEIDLVLLEDAELLDGGVRGRSCSDRPRDSRADGTSAPN